MKRVLLTLLLAPAALGADVEGYVFRTDGTFVEKAKVSVLARATREVLKSATATNGHFKFALLPDAVLDVQVTAEGFETATATVLPNDPPLTVTLVRNADVSSAEMAASRRQRDAGGSAGGDAGAQRTISGTIRVGNKPLAGVGLMLQPMSENGTGPITVFTDAKGAYRAAGLPPGLYMLGLTPGLEQRIRPPWGDRIFEVRRAPNVIDVTTERVATFDADFTLVPFISGRVVDHEGKPVTGAQVRVFVENAPAGDLFGETQWIARTVPGGRYAVPAPPFEATQRVQVIVAPPGHSAFRSKAFVLGTAAHTVDVTLPRYETITVRTIAAGGEPIARATVGFHAIEETMPIGVTRTGPRIPHGVTTNAAGEATLHLLPGDYSFIAVAERFQMRTIPAQTINRPTTVEIALEPAFAIRGKVHRRGRGVAGVHVMIVSHGREGTTYTAADGTYELGGLSRGAYRVAFRKHEELVDRTMEAQAPATLDVELPPTGTIRGRAIDAATREPVRELFYTLEPFDQTRATSQTQRSERTEDGTFTAQVPVGAYRLTVMAAGFTATDPVEVRVTEEKPAEVTIALDRGAIVTGRVTDEAGAPVADAALWAMRETREPQRGREHQPPATARSDANGAYTLTGLEPGRVTIMIRKEGYVPERETIEAGAASTLDVRLSRGLSISGVVTHDGRPAAEVFVGASTAAVDAEHQSSVTDEQGRFTLTGLIPARYTISAFKEGVGQTELPNIDVAQQRTLRIDLSKKAGGIIYGSVTGIPRGSGKVLRRSVMAQSNERSTDAIVDESGNYRIEDAPTGEVWVIAHVETAGSGMRASSRKRVDVTAGQAVRVDLDLGSALAVRGRVTQDGRPYPGASVMFANDAGAVSTATTRDDGTYETSVPEAGFYRIIINAERSRARGFQTRREIRGDASVDIELREQNIEGTVVDAATRQPIAGALVTLLPEQGAQNYIAGETLSDANGRFSIPLAAEGAWTLFASARGYAQRAHPVRDGPITLELSRAGELRVRAIDKRTGAVLSAHVTVADERGVLPVRAEQTVDGSAFVFSLAPGRYKVKAEVQGYPPRTVEATAPGSIDITLE